MCTQDRFAGLLALSLATAATLALSGSARAQTCVGDLVGSVPNCTANDVSLTTLSAIEVIKGCDFIGDIATVRIKAQLRANAQRYDIGFFIATDGGNAINGACHHDFLPPPLVGAGCGVGTYSPTSGIGPFFNGECAVPTDICGDLAAQTDTFYDVGYRQGATLALQIACRDSDGDGNVDVATNVSWVQNANSTCTAENDTLPGTSSKCRFVTAANITGLPVPRQTLEVRKVLAPTSDAGRFDLQIDSLTRIPGVGNGGTTGAIQVTAGAHSVAEVAGSAGTNLASYVSSIQCLDQVGRCSNNIATRCLVNAACGTGNTCNLAPTSVASCTNCTSLPLTVPTEQSTIVCTITNTSSALCTNTAAAGGVDQGCQTVINACDTTVLNGTGTTCVDCQTNPDCSVAGDVCNTATKDCVPCLDSGAGGLDQGCEDTTLNACKNGGTDTGTCVDCTATADCSGALVCKTATNTCVECVVDGDCGIGGLCDLATNTCTGCRNDQAAGGVDDGCAPILNACDTTVVNGHGTTCVDCQTDPDCSLTGDVCNTAIKDCVPCLDSGAGLQDKGCDSTTFNACKNGGTDTGVCVDCTVDGDCATGQLCDTTTNTCVECRNDADCGPSSVCDEAARKCVACVDDASYPLIDSGCIEVLPVCVEQGGISGGGSASTFVCAVCADDKTLDSQVDEGCNSTTPICDTNVPDGVCVECNDNTDCGSGEVCDVANGICVGCLDDALAGTVDTGCDAELPVCDLSGAGTGDDPCITCENDAGPGLIDWGCDDVTPFCGFVSADEVTCFACETDGDCANTEVCRQGVCFDLGATDAFDDSYTTTEGTTLTVSTLELGLLGNDHYPPASTVTATVDAGSAPNPTTEGTLTVNPDGTFTFVPVAGFAGTLTFSYTLTNDTNGDSSQAFVTLLVNGRPRPLNDSVVTPEDTPLTFDPRMNDSDPNGGTLTITRIVSGPAHGTATPSSGSVNYRPARDYTGPDSLVYEVCDPTNICATATVSITVTPVNDRPVAGDDIVVTPEDTGILVVVLANDRDVDSPNLIVSRILGGPTRGTVVIQPDYTVLYRPGANFAGTDAFTYEVCDPNNACDDAVVLITVKPVQDAPVAGDDATTTPSGTAVAIPVLDNDSDVDGDPLEVTRIVFPPGSGSATIGADGVITFTPSGSDGAVTFSYEVCDFANLCDIGLVTVTVGGDNTPPEVADDDATTTFDRAIKVPVLDNDSDADGDRLTVTQVGIPASGSATLNDDGSVTYTPGPGFSGQVSFSYTACDGAGACASAVVTIDVWPGDNRPPIATDDVISTRIGRPVSLDPTANDVDPDGDPLAVEDITTAPLHGTAVLGNDGSVTYTPDPGFVGSDTFEVSVTDGEGGFDLSVVTVVVSADDNLPPVAVDDTFDVSDLAATGLDVLVNDSDPNGDLITIVDIVQPASGFVSVTVTGGIARLVFTPTPGLELSGSDTFTYTISDGRGGEGTATVTLVFPGGNRPPVGVGESVITPEDTAVLIIVLENDTDPDGDPISVRTILTPPRHGTVVIDAGGGVFYTPAGDYVGVDVFTYQVCDARNACDMVLVSLEMTAVNDAPRANDDFFSLPATGGSALDVVLNDSDPEFDPLAVTRIVTPPANGNAYVNPDGTVTYEGSGSAGSDSFVYQVCDSFNACDTAKVTVFVGGDNGNPTPVDDEATTVSGEWVEIAVLTNDTDPDGDPLTLNQVEDPAHGTAVIDGDQIVYTPDLDFYGTDIFFYTVCDPTGACGTAFIVVDVAPGDNTPPYAVDDTVQTPESTPVTFDTTGNDVDFDGDTLTVTAVGEPEHGDVTINADGTLTYTPDPGYVGKDTFQVTISDGRGGTSTQRVLVIVTPADNLPPDAIDDSYDVPSDVATVLSVLANDADPDNDTLTIVEVVQPQHGTVAIGPDNTLVLTPEPGYIGPDRFSYTITDGLGGYDTAYVDLVIGDRDHDGLGDGHEVQVTHTDPDDFDSDDDGLSDGEEVAGGEDPLRYDLGSDTDPLDADTDDDGLSDGTEVRGDGPLSAPTDPLNPDSDGDGVNDGVEVGIVSPVPPGVTDGSGLPFGGTDLDKWIPDADPTTTTDPLDDDSDDDGLTDGNEDENGNGKRDGELGITGTPGSGETDAADPDTDGDGIQDGTELGLLTPQGTGTDIAKFQPDLDPGTMTDPRDTDTDDGGVADGDEDLNFNGYQDPGEINPNIGVDDTPDATRFFAEGGSCSGSQGGLALGLVGLCGLLLVRRRRAVR